MPTCLCMRNKSHFLRVIGTNEQMESKNNSIVECTIIDRNSKGVFKSICNLHLLHWYQQRIKILSVRVTRMIVDELPFLYYTYKLFNMINILSQCTSTKQGNMYIN